MNTFPLFANLRDEPCLVVGGGQVAERKIRALHHAGAKLRVVAPELCAALVELRDAKLIDHQAQGFSPEHIGDALLVVAATGDRQVNEQVARAARTARRLCNVVDDPELCSFITPAVVERGAVTVAISTGGRSPTLARWLKARIERHLPAATSQLAALASRWRDSVVKRFARGEDRQRFWLEVFESAIVDDVLAGRIDEAERGMARALNRTRPDASAPGEAYLVGAGPGDAELLTLRGARLLSRADVVMHDSLIGRQVLDLARRDATFIDCGKRAGHHAMKQEDITALLVRLVREGKRVCRLKGGDPLLFGRGGEEAQALAAAGQRFQIVPGVTAASASAAYAGIPLTHRGLADSVSFVTAHGCQREHEPDWADLANPRRTVVFYMGTRRLRRIGAGLIAHGRAPATEVAIVEHATTGQQRRRLCTLQDLAAGTVSNVASPAVVVVGEVVRLATSLEWFEPRASDATLLSNARHSTTLDTSAHRARPRSKQLA